MCECDDCCGAIFFLSSHLSTFSFSPQLLSWNLPLFTNVYDLIIMHYRYLFCEPITAHKLANSIYVATGSIPFHRQDALHSVHWPLLWHCSQFWSNFCIGNDTQMEEECHFQCATTHRCSTLSLAYTGFPSIYTMLLPAERSRGHVSSYKQSRNIGLAMLVYSVTYMHIY